MNIKLRNGGRDDSLLRHILQHHIYDPNHRKQISHARRLRTKLTDKVVKPEQCPREFTIAFHDNPDTGTDTPVDQL